MNTCRSRSRPATSSAHAGRDGGAGGHDTLVLIAARCHKQHARHANMPCVAAMRMVQQAADWLTEYVLLSSGRRGDRLDWMYQGGLAAKEDAAKKAEVRASLVLHDDDDGSEGISNDSECMSKLLMCISAPLPPCRNTCWGKPPVSPGPHISRR